VVDRPEGKVIGLATQGRAGLAKRREEGGLGPRERYEVF